MKNTLKNLGYFSSYVSDNPLNDTKGALTIVSNHSENYTDNDLRLYIDKEFIASGFGFPNKSSYLAGINAIETLRSEVNEINSILGSNQDNNILKNTSLKYTYIDNNNQNNNIFGQEYNDYGMVLSYNYLQLNYNSDDTQVSYTLVSLNKRTNNFITNISVSINQDNSHISESIDGNITLTFNSSQSNVGLADYQINYGIPSNMNNFSLQNISINGERQYNQSFSFDSPGKITEEDFNIQIIHNYLNNSYPVYSYTYPKLLKWKNYMQYSSSSNINNYNGDYTIVNEFNLTDSATPLTGEIGNAFSNIINIENFNIYYSYDEDIELNFQNSTPLYDYIYLIEDADVEFYFNGIRSNNWHGGKIEKSIDGTNQTFYIYQSPQKYIGLHKWIIKISKKSTNG